MSIFTTEYYDTTLWQPVDTIVVTHTESVSIFRGIIAGIGGIIGGKSETMNKKMDDITSELISKMRAKVRSNQMIVGLRFQFTTFGREEANVFVSGVATGTLVQRRQDVAKIVQQKGGRRSTRRAGPKPYE